MAVTRARDASKSDPYKDYGSGEPGFGLTLEGLRVTSDLKPALVRRVHMNDTAYASW